MAWDGYAAAAVCEAAVASLESGRPVDVTPGPTPERRSSSTTTAPTAVRTLTRASPTLGNGLGGLSADGCSRSQHSWAVSRWVRGTALSVVVRRSLHAPHSRSVSLSRPCSPSPPPSALPPWPARRLLGRRQLPRSLGRGRHGADDALPAQPGARAPRPAQAARRRQAAPRRRRPRRRHGRPPLLRPRPPSRAPRSSPASSARAGRARAAPGPSARTSATAPARSPPRARWSRAGCTAPATARTSSPASSDDRHRRRQRRPHGRRRRDLRHRLRRLDLPRGLVAPRR